MDTGRGDRGRGPGGQAPELPATWPDAPNGAAERAADLVDLRDRAAAALGVVPPEVPAEPGPFVPVADDLGSADAATPDPAVVLVAAVAEAGRAAGKPVGVCAEAARAVVLT